MEEMHKRQYRGATFYLKSSQVTNDGLIRRYQILLEDADGIDVNYMVTIFEAHENITIVTDMNTGAGIENKYLINKIITFLNKQLKIIK